MNKEQGAAERDYRLVKAVFTGLRDKGIITDAELSALKKECVRRLKPMVGGCKKPTPHEIRCRFQGINSHYK